MTPEQIRRAKAIIEHAAVHSLETEEIQLLGWALQRIEELEAGRDPRSSGQCEPIATQGQREKDVWNDGFAHGWRVGSDEERAGRVVVPELTAAIVRKLTADAEARSVGQLHAINEWFRENARAIPADRVLGEGQVPVDREEIAILREIAGRWLPPFGVPHNSETVEIFDRLHALRSGEKKGGEG